MNLRDMTLVLRRSWIAISAFLLLGLATAMLVILIQKPTYEATAKAYVSTQSATTVTDLSLGATFSEQVVKSYADVAETPFVLSEVINRLHLQTSPSKLADQITVVAPTDTVILQVTAADHLATRAALIANAVTNILSARASRLTPSVEQSGPPVKITQIQAAAVPSMPASPRIGATTALGLLAGLAVGVAFAVGRDRLDTRIRSVEELEALGSVPQIGNIPFDSDTDTHALIVGPAARGSRAEAYRALRTNLQFLEYGGRAKAFVVSSSVPSEGKSVSASNAAVAIADAGENVIIIDADLRKPTIATYFGIDGSVGLTDVLLGRVEFEAALQPWGVGKLRVLPAGKIPPNPSELLQSTEMIRVMERAKELAPVVIYDAPPLLPVTDAAILAKQADGVLFVCAIGKTRRGEVIESLKILSTLKSGVLGSIATMVPRGRGDAYGYAYGYRQEAI